MKKIGALFICVMAFAYSPADAAASHEQFDWACCTVSNSDSEVTVCRADGNLRKACREARAILE